MIKFLLRKPFFNPRIARTVAKFLLRCHSVCYHYLSLFAVAAEQGIHPKHRIMKYHRFFVDNISESDIVLDIGCGNGALTYDLSQKAKYVFGIDVSPRNIDCAKKRYHAENITYVVGDARTYSFEGEFDVIVMSNVLEHIEHRVAFLSRMSKFGKKFLIRVPMVDRDWTVLYKKEMGLEYKSDAAHYIEYTFDSFLEELAHAKMRLNSHVIRFGEIWATVVN